jgi:hypothetical protein
VKVLLDFVPNHTSDRHPWFAESRTSRQSAKRDWYIWRDDVMWHLIKDDLFRDNPPNPDFRAGDPPCRRLLPLYSADRPDVHDVVRGLRAVLDEFSERVLIGEIYLPRATGRVLRPRPVRRTFAVQFRPAGGAMARPRHRAIGRSLRGRIAGGRVVAELGIG